MVPRETAIDGRLLGQALKKHGATMLQGTPVTWHLLAEAGVDLRGIKGISTGEALTRQLADRVAKLGATLWNYYGPSETTIDSTGARVGPGPETPTIGRPLANTQGFILDRNMQPVPMGVPGEL